MGLQKEKIKFQTAYVGFAFNLKSFDAKSLQSTEFCLKKLEKKNK